MPYAMERLDSTPVTRILRSCRKGMTVPHERAVLSGIINAALRRRLRYTLQPMTRFLCALCLALLAACDGQIWNNPYPASQAGANILYSAFTERPKHLDPVQSYASNEYTFIAQIYQPPLQYHYLKRPYELIPFG